MGSNINKVKYYLKKYKQVESSVQFILSAGGAYHDGDKPGISHFLEHVLVSETANLNHVKHQEYIFTNDIYTNASTSITVMSFTASAHSSDYKKMFDLLCDYIFSPRFDLETIERERNIIIREIAERKGDPSYILNKFIRENIFTENSVSLVDILGTAESLATITTEDLKKRHIEMLDKSAFIVSSIGSGVDSKYIHSKVSNYEDFISKSSNLFLPTVGNLKNNLKDFKVLKLQHEYAHDEVILGIFVPLNIERKDEHILQIFHELVFNSPHGILYRKLREELKLIYSLSGYYDTNLKGFLINFVIGMSNSDTTIKVILEIFNNLIEYISEEKFNIIKSHFIKRNEIVFDKPMEVLNYASNIFLDYGEEDTLQNYVDKLEKVEFNDTLNLTKQFINIFTLSKFIAVSKNKDIDKINVGIFT